MTTAQSLGDRSRPVAWLFFDIDEFKGVNDPFCHRARNALLVRVAGELSAQARRNEMFARLHGDEFAVLVPDISGRCQFEPKLPAYIVDELRRQQVRHGRLLLEFSQTAVGADLQDAQRFIATLREAGRGR